MRWTRKSSRGVLAFWVLLPLFVLAVAVLSFAVGYMMGLERGKRSLGLTQAPAIERTLPARAAPLQIN